MDSSWGTEASISAQRNGGYLHLCAVAFLYWDHIITFSSEVEFIWKRPKSKSSCLFLLNRYFSSTGNIVVTYGLFSPNLSSSSCNRLGIFRELLLVFTQLIVCVLLTLRTWALYACSRRVLIFILCCLGLLATVACFTVFYGHQNHSVVNFTGCHTGSKSDTAISTSAWEALFAYDGVIFVMILLRAYKAKHSSTLLQLILRDDSIYFAIMTLANLANILTFYLTGPYMKGGLSTLASVTSVTLMSRLILRLHERVSITAYETNQSTCEFAVRTDFEEPDVLFVERCPRNEEHHAGLV